MAFDVMHAYCVTAFLILFSTIVIDASPYEMASEYLRKFDFLNGDTSFDDGLRAFQTEVGLPPTGRVDRRTMRYMRQPRCGVTDAMTKSGGRAKRFVAADEKWGRNTLTWKLKDPESILKSYDSLVVRYVHPDHQATTDIYSNTLHRAFRQWTDGTRSALTFRETADASDEESDIIIFFASGEHNDSLPFDGKDGVVAHGFYPTNGNLHFDASENWTLNMGAGVNLYQTAVHEIGHLLGLHHSADRHAVMFPLNRPYNPSFALSDDDVRGIRYLYTPWTWHHYMRRYLMRWRQMQQTVGQ